MNQAKEVNQTRATKGHEALIKARSNVIKLSPLPMQYLGSKDRIAQWIGDRIFEHFPDTNHIIDLFAGSGVVSIDAIARGATVTANDIQPYSYCVLKALFTSHRHNLKDLIEHLRTLDAEKELLAGGRHEFRNLLCIEDHFMYDGHADFNWREYAEFCKNTEVINDNDAVPDLKANHDWNLISKYYANTYFGVRQCLELDMLRELSEGLEEDLKVQLIGAAISSMTYLVSSTTHLAQFLKISSDKTAANLIKKRKKSILDDVISRLELLSQYGEIVGNSVLNMDYLDVVRSQSHSGSTVIYADPPYFKEHYSRYYHLLDTFYFYDFPELTYNPRISGITTGRYRKDRIVSDFGLKSRVRTAFGKLFNEGSKRQLPIVLSYANTSLVEKEELIEMAEAEGYQVRLFTTELMHSGQGQKRNKNVIEYLFICSI